MSRTYSLVCHETKQRIWIGQGGCEMLSLYYGEPQTMENLRRFLNHHADKRLDFVCDDLNDSVREYRAWQGLAVDDHPCDHSNRHQDGDCPDCGAKYEYRFAASG